MFQLSDASRATKLLPFACVIVVPVRESPAYVRSPSRTMVPSTRQLPWVLISSPVWLLPMLPLRAAVSATLLEQVISTSPPNALPHNNRNDVANNSLITVVRSEEHT